MLAKTGPKDEPIDILLPFYTLLLQLIIENECRFLACI